jgi:hypothetical protein
MIPHLTLRHTPFLHRASNVVSVSSSRITKDPIHEGAAPIPDPIFAIPTRTTFAGGR